jgi:hypothetical protein
MKKTKRRRVRHHFYRRTFFDAIKKNARSTGSHYGTAAAGEANDLASTRQMKASQL